MNLKFNLRIIVWFLSIQVKDIRKFLVRSVSKTGGHLASNLGVVELTLAHLKGSKYKGETQTK